MIHGHYVSGHRENERTCLHSAPQVKHERSAAKISGARPRRRAEINSLQRGTLLRRRLAGDATSVADATA